MIANVSMWKEFAQRISKKTFQKNSWLADKPAVWIWSWVQLKHPWQAAKMPPGYATRNKFLVLNIHKVIIVLSLFFTNCVNAIRCFTQLQNNLIFGRAAQVHDRIFAPLDSLQLLDATTPSYRYVQYTDHRITIHQCNIRCDPYRVASYRFRSNRCH